MLLYSRTNLFYEMLIFFQIDSRRLIDIFIMLPARRDYPDYYQVISEPIDMTIIETKLKQDKVGRPGGHS